MELQGRAETLRKAGMGLAAVSYDSRETLASFAARKSITFPLLSDPGSAIIKRYGLVNTEVAPDHEHFGIPFPGTFILDPNGRVTARFFETAYQSRNTVASIVERLDLPANVQPASVQQLTPPNLALLTYPTDDLVAPGTRFSLVVDITPAPDVHVYAPPETSYRPLALTLTDDAAFTAHPIRYPASEEYFFKPLKERVRVYVKRTRIVQDVTVALTPEMRARVKIPGAALTIAGRLSYQACTHEICFIPESVPLTWTVRLKPFEE